jgi:hypothetical protein
VEELVFCLDMLGCLPTELRLYGLGCLCGDLNWCVISRIDRLDFLNEWPSLWPDLEFKTALFTLFALELDFSSQSGFLLSLGRCRLLLIDLQELLSRLGDLICGSA